MKQNRTKNLQMYENHTQAKQWRTGPIRASVERCIDHRRTYRRFEPRGSLLSCTNSCIHPHPLTQMKKTNTTSLIDLD
ncbi:hypothetical protein HanPI659440_Chr09g0338191 [Helianthus annuus]|nr:hypothetical protein HanPI659440_Chr09g0338191 [Helianthus annuus]